MPIVFFALAKGHFRSFGTPQEILRIVAALPLAISCIGHFARPAMYAAIVPPIFPHAVFIIVVTGIMELAGAIGLVLPKTTRRAAVCITLLMIAVFPANIYAANQMIHGLHMPSAPIRLAMQVIYIVLVLLTGWGIPRPTRTSSPA